MSTISRSVASNAGSVAGGGGGMAGADGRGARSGGRAPAVAGGSGGAPLSARTSASDCGGAAGRDDGQLRHNSRNALAPAATTIASAVEPLGFPVT